jgi:hypothetical protein
MSEREDLEFAQRVAEPLRAPERAQPDFEARLASGVHAAVDRGEAPWARGRGVRRSFHWLVAPRRLAVSPLAGLALAAGFAALVVGATLVLTEDRGLIAPATVATENGQVVQFAIVAPNASTVTLVGDFNAWDTKTTPMRKGAVDGLWTVTVPLAAGNYQYAFVVDGTTWMADPAASVALEDEFGTPSSILTIRGGRT